MNNWRFGVVGNIVCNHIDEDGIIYHGTKEFAGGTRVYIDGKNWSNCPRNHVVVLGLNRYKKYETACVNPKLVENVRFKVIRKPKVLEVLDAIQSLDGWEWYGRTAKDKKAALKFVEDWDKLVQEVERIKGDMCGRQFNERTSTENIRKIVASIG